MADDRVALAHGRLLRLSPDLVALTEEPGARDDQEVGVAPDVGGKRGERRGHFYDAKGGGVEHLESGRPIELDRLDRSVGSDRHGQPEVAICLAARFGRIVDAADALDLHPPVLFVLRESIFGAARTDELLSRPLLVFVDLAVDLRLKPHGRERKVGEITAAWLVGGLVGLRRALLLGQPPLHFLLLSQQKLLLRLKLLATTLRDGEILAGVARLGYRQRCPRTPVLVDVA